MRPNGVKVAANGSEDAPSVAQFDSRHPVWGLHRFCRRRTAAVSPGSATGASWARFFGARPNCERQRNSSPVTIPCFRATAEPLTPGRSVSSAIACFCSSLKKRRFGRGGADGTSFRASVKLLREAHS